MKRLDTKQRAAAQQTTGKEQTRDQRKAVKQSAAPDNEDTSDTVKDKKRRKAQTR